MTGKCDSFGPFAEYEAMHAAALAGGRTFSELLQVQELFRYDGYIIDIVKLPDGSIYLRNTIDEGDRTKGAPDDPRIAITHYLRFPSAEAILATIHDGMAPTFETYRTAEAIVREEVSWNNAGAPRNWTIRYTDLAVDDLSIDEMPYRALKPGKVIQFDPFDPHGRLPHDQHLHRWPVAVDTVISGNDDQPTAWLGYKDGFYPHHVIRVIAQSTDGKQELRHHLSFKDEEDMAALLREGGSALYQRASTIDLETIDRQADQQLITLKVERLKIEDIQDIPPVIEAAAGRAEHQELHHD